MKKLLSICLLVVFYSTTTGQTLFFEKAVPVWASGRQVEKNLTVSFRTGITWDGKSDVLFRLTACSAYRTYVNGVFLGHGPCVAGEGYFRVDEYNLGKWLKPGHNIIAVEVTGYNVDSYYLMNQPSFLQAEITSNGKVVAATNTKRGSGEEQALFEAALLGQRLKDVPKYTFQRTYMEAYRLTSDYREWMTSNVHTGFKPVSLERTDKKELVVRRVKYPDYGILKSTGLTAKQIYKFEHNATGFIGATVKVHQSSKITFNWDEILVNDDLAVRQWNSIMTFELSPGEYTVESFEPYTLQYLKIIIEGDCEVSDCYIRQYVSSDVSQTSFACNDERINKIYKAAVETFRQNVLDIFMDCPDRERAGWLGDSYFTSRTAFHLSGNTLVETNFFENFLQPVKYRYIPEGMWPMCYPSDHPNDNFIPNFAFWGVMQLAEYMERSGNHTMIEEFRPKVMSLLDYFKLYENEDGLLEGLEKWIMIEWSEANKFVQDVNYPVNMHYAKTLEVVGKMYQLPDLVEKARKIREVICSQSFDGIFFVDNAIRENGKLVPQKNNRTEICQYSAFFFDTATPVSHPTLWNTLLTDFGPDRKTTGKHSDIYPSNIIFGKYMRSEILSRYGLAKQLLNESIDDFLYMANRTGTIWENTTTVASCNHGMASYIAYLFYCNILGINHVDQQKKHITITFNNVDITSCRGTVPAGDQLITLSWEKKGKSIQYKLSIPDGYKVDIKNNTNYKLAAI